MTRRTPLRHLSFPATFTLMTLLGLSGCDTEPEVTEPAERPAKMMALETPEELASRRFSGRTEAADRSMLSFRVPGEIEQLHAEVGDEVEQGKVLARLDQRDFQLKVRELQNQLDATEATLNEARSNYRRGEELVDSGAISEAEFDRLESQFRQARGRHNATREALETAQAALDDTVLKAPFDGVINQRLADAHEQVSPDRPVFAIDNIQTIEIQVGIPERLMRFRNRLERVHVHLPALDDATREARVESIGLDVAPDIQAYPVRVALDNSERDILPGMTAEVSFHASLAETAWDDSFLVPVSAVAKSNGDAQVWVWDPDSREVEPRRVDTQSLETDSVRVSGDISSGDVIVIAGAHHLREGQRVRRMEAGEVVGQ